MATFAKQFRRERMGETVSAFRRHFLGLNFLGAGLVARPAATFKAVGTFDNDGAFHRMTASANRRGAGFLRVLSRMVNRGQSTKMGRIDAPLCSAIVMHLVAFRDTTESRNETFTMGIDRRTSLFSSDGIDAVAKRADDTAVREDGRSGPDTFDSFHDWKIHPVTAEIKRALMLRRRKLLIVLAALACAACHKSITAPTTCARTQHVLVNGFDWTTTTYLPDSLKRFCDQGAN